ncbi:MAG: ornithine cyclodeaminase family protein, partial [Alphaproteobacteria bacterium]|nr:ornithine cyclodeaminase family protein [Alphaproteobacteria bacterium]
MKWISAEEVAARTPYGDLVEALREGFMADIETPVRHHHDTINNTTLLLMPAWGAQYTGLKTTTFKPDNPAQGFPTIQAVYMLIDNQTASPVCLMDGTELTRRRTAAASALAADYLARKDSSTLLLVGAGALGRHFVLAHAAVRPIKTVLVYNRGSEKSHQLAALLTADGFAAEVVGDVEAATRRADIISCVTSATAAIIKG